MTKKTIIQVDILISGGGPVGLAAACALSETGLKVLLVDAGKEALTTKSLQLNADIASFDLRVSALTVASKDLLDNVGVWEAIKSVRVSPYESMQVWDGEGTGSVHFSAADIHLPGLGHIVENRLITAALTDVAKTKPLLGLRHDDKVSEITLASNCAGQDENQPEQRVLVNLASGETIATRLLIGADGGNSFIREKTGFSIRQWDYGHQAIVTTVKTEKPHEFTAWQRFMNTGPLAFLPLHLPAADQQYYCSIVWSCVTDKAEALMALDDEAFKQVLGEAFEFRLGKIVETDVRVSFPLWQRHATDYIQENIALIGDAAHTIHPLAGQGVNLGLADVQVLAEVIADALEKGEDFACHQVLSRYQRNRKGKNLAMMAAMEGFKQIFESEDLFMLWLRNSGLNIADKTPLLKHRLMRQAMGL